MAKRTTESKHGDEVRKALRGCMWDVTLVWDDAKHDDDWQIDYTVGPFQDANDAAYSARARLKASLPNTADNYSIRRLAQVP